MVGLVAIVLGLGLLATQLGRRSPERVRDATTARHDAGLAAPSPGGALTIRVTARPRTDATDGDGADAAQPDADGRTGGGRADGDAAGAPIGDAEVLALDGAGRTVAVARTDASGRARLAPLPDGTFTLVVARASFARAVRVARVAGGVGEARVTLGPGATLSGQVVDEEGAAVAEARLSSWPDDASLDAPETQAPATRPWTVRADRAGGFTFDTLAPGGAVRVEASAPGFETATRRAVLLRAGAPALRLVLRRTGRIAGRVRGPDGANVQSTIVLAGSGVWPPRSVETDASGAYQIDGVPGGVYEVRARHGGLVATPREGLLLAPGGALVADLELAVGATLRVEVRDADAEAPLEGAEIVVTEDALAFAPRAARSGRDGTLAVEGLRAIAHRCAVQAAGYVSLVAEACAPGDAPVRFALRRAAEIRGVVVDALGAPIRGAQVEVGGTTDSGASVAMSSRSLAFRAALFEAQRAGPPPLRPAGELGVTLGGVPPIPIVATVLGTHGPDARTTGSGTSGGDGGVEAADDAVTMGFGTDAEGRFRIAGVPPGRITLVARHLAYAPGFTPPRVVVAGARIEDVRIVLPEGGTVDGRVTDARGFPIEAIRVELMVPGEPAPRGLLAGADGRFEFRGVVGEVVLTAFPPGAPPVRTSVRVFSGAVAPVTLALEGELRALRGRVVDARGFPIAGARVRVRSLRSRTPFAQTTESGDDGTWSIEGMPLPPWSLEADHTDYALTRLAEVDDAARELRVMLAPCAAVRGVVTDSLSGAGLRGARVRLRGAAGSFEADTQTDGAWDVLRVPAGAYGVQADHASYVTGTAEIVVAERGRTLADVEGVALALVPGGALRGEVVDALGAPVSGAEVTAGPAGVPPDWTRAARTDPRGGFVLRGVPAGDAWPCARHPAAGETLARYPARVRVGEETPGLVLRLPERFDKARGDARLAADPAGTR